MMKHIKIRLNQRGQVAIFTLLIFSLLFMFFGMSINIAMLVHHKINLQNAADMAAMAGAAEQARIMNLIAWKNYELRKNFKDFMYAYWVEFNDRNFDFPDPRPPFADRLVRNRGANGEQEGFRWTTNPARRDQNGNQRIAIPSYCLGDQFGIENKTCDALDLPYKFPRIDPRTATFITLFDPLYSGQVAAQLTELAIKKQQQSIDKWEYYSEVNRLSLRQDIFTYMQRAKDIYRFFLNPDNPASLPGLMNSAMNQGVEWDSAPSLQQWQVFNNTYLRSPDRAKNMSYVIKEFQEKPQNFTQLAQLTAYKNLNYANQHGFTFEQLEPQNGYIQFHHLRNRGFINFKMFWTEFQLRDRVYITPQPIFVENFPVAIEKTKTPTFYAVKLDSEPDLPFMPTLTEPISWKLTAVSAAQPFGSRIGPEFHREDFTIEVPSPDGSPGNITLPHICLGNDCDPAHGQYTDALDNVRNLYHLKMEVGPFEGENLDDQREPILRPTIWEEARYNLPDETSMESGVHDTDYATERHTLAIPGHPYSLNYGSRNSRTSWNPARAGYGIKLIPIGKIIDQLDPAAQATLDPVRH